MADVQSLFGPQRHPRSGAAAASRTQQRPLSSSASAPYGWARSGAHQRLCSVARGSREHVITAAGNRYVSGLYVISANKALRTICASPLCTQFKQAVLSLPERRAAVQTIMRSSILFLLAVGATSFAAPPLAKPPRFQQRRAPRPPWRSTRRFSTEGRRRGPRRPAVLITTRHDAVVCISHETSHSSTAGWHLVRLFPLYDLNPLVALLKTLDTHIVNAVVDREHATVILFNRILGATIGLVKCAARSPGRAVVETLR